MRYFEVGFRGNSEEIKNNSKIKTISYATILWNMNDYIWKNIKNNIVFFFYQ